MEFLTEYGLFLAKTVTWLVALVVVIGIIASAGQKVRQSQRGHIEVTALNEAHEHHVDTLRAAVLDEDQLKMRHKAEEKQKKQEAKARRKALKKKSADQGVEDKPRLFVLNFDGDIKASAVESLREEVTTVLSLAQKGDEIVLRLESGGGMVHSYGLAASQLDRIRKRGVALTVCVDKVAASGGYMMACVADRILAAPFAVIGSIGVVAQLPNFHRLLKHNRVDFELLTAGEHKRTLTMFGENTDQGRQKFVEDLEDTHELFKSYVAERRSVIDIAEVANGDVWFGERALEKNLVDELITSDEYIASKYAEADVYEVAYVQRKSLQEKLGVAAEGAMDRLLLKWMQRSQDKRIIG